MKTPIKCSTRGHFFEPLSSRKERVRQERAARRREAVARYAQQQRDLAKAQRQKGADASRGARDAFRADSNSPAFDKLQGKKWNW